LSKHNKEIEMTTMMNEDRSTIVSNLADIMFELKHIEAYIRNNQEYKGARLYDIRTTLNDLSDRMWEARYLIDTYADYNDKDDEEEFEDALM
jgi:hypothetical protein